MYLNKLDVVQYHMSATSEKQRRLMELAKHNPSAVSKKNRGVLSMTKGQLDEFSHLDPVAARKGRQRKQAEKVVKGH